MKLSEAAEFFISKCFEKGEPRIIAPLLNQKYSLEQDGKMHKFTTEVLEEMVQSGCINVRFQDDKMTNISGVEGMAL